jgi:conjugal transfer pilus assembly protein TraW
VADESDRTGWPIVVFQSALIAGLIAGSLLLASAARAETSTIGRTWPIAEPDAMAEIEARAAQHPPNMAEKFGREDRVRHVVPFYTLDTEIRLPDGKLLYPKGFTFNPLTYVSLPQKLVVVHPRDIGWALKTAALTDWIIVTGGGDPSDDALSLGERHGRALFMLEERVKDRLGLTVAPVIIRQIGQKLELTEVRPDRAQSRKANP